MKLRGCSCRQCKHALRGKGGSAVVVKKRRAARHRTKELIRVGAYDVLPVAVALGYLG